MSKQNCRMLQSNDSFDKFEHCFDIVAVGNHLERVCREISNCTCIICFDFVDRIVRLVAFDSVASTIVAGVDGALRSYCVLLRLSGRMFIASYRSWPSSSSSETYVTVNMYLQVVVKLFWRTAIAVFRPTLVKAVVSSTVR